jgi:hypothetical protein
MRGVGSALFVGILLMIAGILNIVYGIAAVGNAHFWVNDTQFVFSTLHTWGWITIILGIIQLTASLSLFGGNAYGRVVGIVAASLGAIGALLDVGGAHPWWALGVFAICVICIHGLVVLGEPADRAAVGAFDRQASERLAGARYCSGLPREQCSGDAGPQPMPSACALAAANSSSVRAPLACSCASWLIFSTVGSTGAAGAGAGAIGAGGGGGGACCSACAA